MSSRRYLPLEEYGLVGDGRSAALIGRDGSVDWWCPPRFDAPSVFARLLDDRIGGFCSVAPAGAVHASPMWESSQRYRPGTNVLVTEFRGADARLEVTDAMPWPGPGPGGEADGPPPGDGGDDGPAGRERTREPGERRAPTLIRRVEARGGPVEAELRFAPRFDYARRRPEYRESAAGWTADAGGDGSLSLSVASDPGLEVDGRRDELTGRFRVEPGAPRWFTLRWGAGRGSEAEPVSAETARDALEATAERWRRRAAEVPVPAAGEESGDGDAARGPGKSAPGSFDGRIRERVVRSALVLDLLTHAPSGAVIETPTTSLPGAGPLRDGRGLPRSRADATAVLAGLLGLGRRREARHLCRRLAEWGPGGRLRGDDRTGPEVGRRGEAGEARVLDHLHGHRGERPVRTGAAGDGAAEDGVAAGRPNGAAAGTDAGGPGDPPAPDGAPPPSLARALEEARDLALAGRREEAEEAFEAAAGRAGPTGLLAEARDPRSGRLRGNVPSAAAHAALVEAARAIASARGGAGTSGGRQKDQ